MVDFHKVKDGDVLYLVHRYENSLVGKLDVCGVLTVECSPVIRGTHDPADLFYSTDLKEAQEECMRRNQELRHKHEQSDRSGV